MLIEQCPHCQQDIQLRDRLVLIYKFYGTCKHCQQDFLPKRGPMVWSSGVIGGITGVLATAILKLDFLSAMGLSLLLVFIIQRFINVFYSLDPLSDG
ncbi:MULTISPECIES: hypothetical protein [unclassified Arsukibacterium]|uniref:hypothetical protein n=1 Tax=unclassified Arsukibacterium TaxID=2635278 RepID=UPI000C61E6EB|nr:MULTISPECIES: hypothetical protein [unclassified Arsukibacterium]MAA95949.1 hypothetical protein [Rheinheimera sp.]MBM34747.1 hypothetical protein [Rheinheimera sp.]HAW91665.1 hypothetical protein [Candidatus Azambacteria bacterium]|tara:strand:- start:166 stop:456 length:291 start_codon:yes stop_codon:yes gene_type:complete